MDKKETSNNGIDRRGFLAGTAAAGATVILAGGASPGARPPNPNPGRPSTTT